MYSVRHVRPGLSDHDPAGEMCGRSRNPKPRGPVRELPKAWKDARARSWERGPAGRGRGAGAVQEVLVRTHEALVPGRNVAARVIVSDRNSRFPDPRRLWMGWTSSTCRRRLRPCSLPRDRKATPCDCHGGGRDDLFARGHAARLTICTRAGNRTLGSWVIPSPDSGRHGDSAPVRHRFQQLLEQCGKSALAGSARLSPASVSRSASNSSRLRAQPLP
jgi:hypothetical protein